MADLARVKNNVAKMVAQNAPEADIDGYIESEGVTIDDVKNFRADQSSPVAEKASRLPEDPVAAEKAKQDEFYSSGIYAGSYNPLGPIARTVGAVASGAQRAPLFGWDDEAQAGIATAAGTNGNYEASRAGFNARKQAQRAQAPVASAVGELAGGLATGGTIASTGATLAGRSLPVIGRAGGAAIEGAGYGALVGAGEANPDERGAGALMGGAVGAVTGGVASKVGDALASRFARRAAQAAAPSADDLAAQAKPLYDQAYQSGVAINPQSADRVINNMKFAAGRPNERLRPQTMGLVEDLDAMAGQPMDIQTFHELRQTVDKAMKTAQGPDQATLGRMRSVLNGFADNIDQANLTGPKTAVDTFRKADDLWRKSAKASKIEDLFDLADVDSAKYSQSGMQNAIKLKAKQLYTKIVKGQEKGFTGQEVDLIRKLAKGEMTSKTVELAAKFAPRGVISFGAGMGLGTAIGGPVGAAIPGMIGFGASQLADRAAVGGVQALRNAAASGTAPVLGAITNKTVPFIGGASSALSSQINRR
jgi:hypothetical protein